MTKINHNHPPSLRTFFATEMWERYGFYVVQTLLALYLALHFQWHDRRVYALVGSFTALTYLSPVIGGWIADHLLGQKRAILTGAGVLLASYTALSFVSGDLGLTMALAGIAVGTGLLKPNISSLLGNEYPLGSPIRDQGFTIFYMGITSGIILGTTLPSYLNHYYGWSVPFASAAIGILIAIITFVLGIKKYRIRDYHPFEYHVMKIIRAALMMIGLWLAALLILQFPLLADNVFILVAILSIGYLIQCIKQEEPLQARQTLVILFLCIISATFWAFYFQMFLSLTLFIVRVVKPTLFGLAFSPPMYVGIQSVGMILFGFLIARSKASLKDHLHQGIKAGNKFVMAMLLMTLAYCIITIVCNTGVSSAKLSPLVIIPAYLLISLAELLLSPVGLSTITLLSSPKKVSTMMGIFFVSLGIGGFLSGKLAALTAVPIGVVSPIAMKQHYADAFSHLLYFLVGATIICFFLNRMIKYFMRELPRERICA